MQYKQIKVDFLLNKVTKKDNLFLGDYTIDPYQNCEFGCRYCDSSFDKTIYVKHNADKILEKELETVEKGRIIVGSVHDPYQKIDEDFHIAKTDWLCDIENVDFLKTTFGKRASEDSGFFNGLIDEFKFIKYDGGNEQEIPEISGPAHGDVDTEIEYTFVTNDPEGDNISIKIDWGDGEITDWLEEHKSGEEFKVSHSWDVEGEYEI